MAKNVTAIQLGAQPKIVEASTVGEIMEQFDLKDVSIKVNGKSATAETELSEYDHVAFGEKVKGGR